jgi:hypothetical protein
LEKKSSNTKTPRNHKDTKKDKNDHYFLSSLALRPLRVEYFFAASLRYNITDQIIVFWTKNLQTQKY